MTREIHVDSSRQSQECIHNGLVIPDLQAAIVCEDVRLEVNGANTLVGVINIIAVPAVPFRVLKLCVFTRWVSGEGTFAQKVRILHPDESRILAATDTQFILRPIDIHTTNIAVFGGLEFTDFGDYPVEILLDGDLKMRFLIRVVQINPNAQPPFVS